MFLKNFFRRQPDDARIYFDIIDNSATPTFAIDRKHKVLIWNKACEKLTGQKAAGVLGTDRHWQPFYDFKRPTVADLIIDGKAAEATNLYPIVHTDKTFSEGGLQAEGWYPKLGGTKRYIFFTAAPIKNEKGEIIAAVETLEDITERKLSDEKHLEDLKEKAGEIDKTDQLIVARELKMIELKKEIEYLKNLNK